jgi:hypothetical protein
MRALLDRYIRSLKERDDHPEQRNDLGTLVTWILERERFTVLERAFKHAGHERRVSKGRSQLGIDLLAIREENGELVSYRLVLKRGDVTTFIPGDAGSMASDLWLAAQEMGREQRYGYTPDRITVVAVHNGDRDSEGLGQIVEGQLESMRAKTGARTEWWDAARLVDKIAAHLLGAHGADASFFPPALQPFVRLTLDSLLPERGVAGSGFDLAALDLLIERRLALYATGAPGAAVDNAEELHRRLAELSLVAWMIRGECARVASSTTLPTLDAIERVLCGALAAASALPNPSVSALLREDLMALLGLHVETAERLLEKLRPLLGVDAGLAAPAPGETISYPLRVLRLSGYLAVAGLAAHAGGNEALAGEMAASLRDLWDHNEGGCLQPVTDDQLIEIVCAWQLWTLVGMHEVVGRTAARLIDRLAGARALGLPLPAL